MKKLLKFIQWLMGLAIYGAVFGVVYVYADTHWFSIPDKRVVESILKSRPVKFIQDRGPLYKGAERHLIWTYYLTIWNGKSGTSQIETPIGTLYPDDSVIVEYQAKQMILHFTGSDDPMNLFPGKKWDATISYDDFLRGKGVEIITWDELGKKIDKGII